MKTLTIPFLLAALMAGSMTLSAQEGDTAKPKKPLPEDLEKIVDYDQDLLIDYGGWIHLEAISFDDKPTRDHRRLRFYDLRLWASVDWGDRTKAYFRLKNTYTDYNMGDAYDDREDDEITKLLRLDQGYIERDLTGEIFDASLKLNVRVGRQYFRLGRGLAYSNVHDGISFEFGSPPFSATALVAQTVTSADDVDQSRPDKDDSHRLFAGGEFSYQGVSNTRMYAFTLIQRDRNEEDPENALQNYRYDSEYLGLGVRTNPVPRLTFHGEFVYETGHSVATGSTEPEPIRAYATTLTAQYLWDVYSHPQITAEFMYGSGDSDRDSPINTSGGNEPDTKDKSFVHFGYIQTGFSLFPKLSNISIYKIGIDFNPLESYENFEDFGMSVIYYKYLKNESEGGISDSRAFEDDDDVGSEIDAILRWRVTSDIGFDAIYSVFFPGGAYEAQNDRQYMSIGVTYNF